MVICKVEQNLTKYVTSILKYLQAATSICKLGFCNAPINDMPHPPPPGDNCGDR